MLKIGDTGCNNINIYDCCALCTTRGKHSCLASVKWRVTNVSRCADTRLVVTAYSHLSHLGCCDVRPTTVPKTVGSFASSTAFQPQAWPVTSVLTVGQEVVLVCLGNQ